MKKYIFKPYNKIFPELFEREKQKILTHFKSDLLIEHVGSTAVPGLGGKGIVDIAIAVDQSEMERVCLQLQNLGYEFRPAFSTPDRFFFCADLPDLDEDVRRYHIHLTYPESQDWKDLIALRDYLRAHPSEALEYASLKEKAAASAHDEGEKYRKMKEPLIQKMLSNAREPNGQ
ncbi:MAG: GrpB family protein [Chlamydiota bacterium]